jgi:hypothetical protein
MNTQKTTKKGDLQDVNQKVEETTQTPQNLEKATEKEATKEEAKIEINRMFAPPSPEQRLKNLENLKIIGERYNVLLAKQDELNKFFISSDGTKEKIVLSNSNGFMFDVSNTQVIEKVLILIQTELDAFIAKTGEEISNFVV